MASGGNKASLNIIAKINKTASVSQIKQDLLDIEKKLPALKLYAALDKKASVTQIKNDLPQVMSRLPALMIKLKLDPQAFKTVQNQVGNLIATIKGVNQTQANSSNQSAQAMKRQAMSIGQVTSQMIKQGEVLKRNERYLIDSNGITYKGQTVSVGNKYSAKSLNINTDANNEVTSFTLADNAFKEQLRLRRLGQDITSQLPGGLSNGFNKQALDDYIKTIYGANAAVTNFATTFDTANNKVHMMDVTIQTGADTYKKLKVAVDETSNTIRQKSEQDRKSINRDLSVWEQMTNAIEKVPIWLVATTVTYAPLRAFQKGLESIKEIDAAMADLKKVTDETAGTYDRFALSANQTAISLGKTTSEVIEATAEFARLGYSIEQASKLANSALMFSNVGGIDVQTASQNIISAMKGFNIQMDESGKNAQHIVDVYNEIGNKFAITSGGLGEAISRSAATLQEAGNTFEQAAALSVTANTTIQDPNKVGTALNTVAMRLRGVGEDGQIANSQILTLEKSFNKVGLTIKKNDLEFKSTAEIFDDLSKIWDKLSGIQQANLIEQIAGKRQGNIVASMLNNWKEYSKALDAAMNSENSAVIENAKAMDTIQAKQKQAATAMEEFWLKTVSSDGYKQFLDVITATVKGFTVLTQTIGLLPTVLSSVLIALMLFSQKGLISVDTAAGSLLSKFPLIGTAVDGLSAKLVVAQKSLQATASGTGALASGARIAAGAIGFLNTAINAIAMVAVFTAITVALSAITKLVGAWYEKQKAIREEVQKSLDSYQNSIDTISSLYKTYKELIEKSGGIKSNLSTNDQEKLVETQNKLAKLLPGVAQGFDEQGNAIMKNIDTVEMYMSTLDQVAEKQATMRLQSAAGDLAKLQENTQNAMQTVKDFQNIANDSLTRSGTDSVRQKTIEDMTKDQIEISAALAKFNDVQKQLSDKFYQTVQDTKRGNNTVKNLTEADKEFYKNYVNSVLDSISNGTSKYKGPNAVNDFMKKALDDYQKLAEARTLLTKSDIPFAEKEKQIVDIFAKTGLGINYAVLMLNEYEKSLDKSVQIIETAKAKQADFTTEVNSFISAQKDLADAYQQLSDGEQLSLDNVLKLLGSYPELIAYITAENGTLKLNADGIKEIAKLKEQEFKNEMQRKKTDLEETVRTTKAELTAKLQAARAEMDINASLDKMRKDGITSYVEDIEKQIKSYEKAQGRDYSDSAYVALLRQRDFLKDSPNKDTIQQLLDTEKTLKDIEAVIDKIGTVDFTSQLMSEAANKNKKDLNPYELKDYEHADAALEQAIAMAKNSAELYAGKYVNADGSINKDAIEKYQQFTEAQVKAYRERQRIAHEEAERLRAEDAILKAQFEGMADSDKKNELMKQWDDQEKKIGELSQKWWDFEKSINDLTIVDEKDITKVNAYANAIKVLDTQFNELSNNEDTFKKQSKDFRDNISKELDLNQQRIDLTQTEITKQQARVDNIKDELKNSKLLASQREDLIKLLDDESGKLEELKQKMSDYQKVAAEGYQKQEESRKEWVDSANQLADKVIDVIKKSIEKQRDAELDAIDDVEKKEKERHDAKVKQLDQEMKQFEDNINAQIKLLDDQVAQEDYNKNLKKEMETRDEIQKKIDALSLDNSMEAKAQRIDLEKQLKDENEKIADIQHKHDIDLRKKNLQETLQAKQKETNSIKDADQEAFDNAEKLREEEKDAIKHKYQEMLDDEANFNKIRTDILQGNVEELKKQLGEYWQFFMDEANKNMKQTGKDINSNLSLANELFATIKSISSFDYGSMPTQGSSLGGGLHFGQGDSTTGGTDGTTYGNNPSNIGTTPTNNPSSPNSPASGSNNQQNNSSQQAKEQYVNNKLAYWNEFFRTGEYNNATQQQLRESNNQLRQQYGFEDYTLDKLMQDYPDFGRKVTDFRSYISNKVAWETANDEIKKQLQTVNQSFRDKYGFGDFSIDQIRRLSLASFDAGGYTGDWAGNGGKLAVLHKREQILKENDTINFIKAITVTRDIINMLGKLKTSIPKSEPNSQQVHIDRIEMNIDKLNGDKDGATQLYDDFVNRLQGRGVNL